MMGRTHTAIGTVAALGATQLAHGTVEQEAVMVVAAFLTSGGVLSPDCDVWLPVEHRGPTHWLLTCLVVGASVAVIVYQLAPTYALAAGCGVALAWVVHAFADATTVGGVPLLGPFLTDRRGNQRKVRLLPKMLRFRVGHMQPVWCALILAALLIGASVFYIGQA